MDKPLPTLTELKNNNITYLSRVKEIKWWILYSIFTLINNFLLILWMIIFYPILLFIMFKIWRIWNTLTFEEELDHIKDFSKEFIYLKNKDEN